MPEMSRKDVRTGQDGSWDRGMPPSVGRGPSPQITRKAYPPLPLAVGEITGETTGDTAGVASVGGVAMIGGGLTPGPVPETPSTFSMARAMM
jgi:hypothetical protein